MTAEIAKALRVVLALANRLEESGKFRAAAALDGAAMIMKKAAMDRLPALSIDLWSDEQLGEVLNTPELAEKLAGKVEEIKVMPGVSLNMLAAAVMRALRAGIKVPEEVMARAVDELKKFPKLMGKIGPERKPQGLTEVGPAREMGWWGIWLYGQPLGFVDSKSSAWLVKNRLANRFSEDPESAGIWFKRNMAAILEHEIQRQLSTAGHAEWFTTRPDKIPTDTKALRQMMGPGSSRERKKLIEKAVDVFKTPEDFEPSKESVITTGSPDPDTKESAKWDKTYHESGLSADEGNTFGNQANASYRRSRKAAEDFVQPWADEINRKTDLEHPEHEYMEEMEKESSFPPMARKRRVKSPPLSMRKGR